MHVRIDESDYGIVSAAVHRRWWQHRGDSAANGNAETCRHTSQKTACYVRMVWTVGHHHLQSQYAATDTMVSAFYLFICFEIAL